MKIRTRKLLGLLTLLAMLGALLPLTALGKHANDGGVDEPWTGSEMNQESFWETRFGPGAECTKFNDHPGTGVGSYEAVVTKGGDLVRVYNPNTVSTVIGPWNPNGETEDDRHHEISWVMKCNIEEQPPADPIISVSHAGECGAADVTLKWENESELTLQYGITVEVDGVVEDSNLITGPGSDTIALSFDEDQSDGEVDVRYYFTDATEWDYLADQSLNYQATYPEVGDAFVAFTVDTDCEEDTTSTTAPTTTTEPEEETTTTTEPEETTTTTEAEPTTTTVEVEDEEEEATTTTEEEEVRQTDETLPFTGVDSGPLAGGAALALLSGLGLTLLTRKSKEALEG